LLGVAPLELAVVELLELLLLRRVGEEDEEDEGQARAARGAARAERALAAALGERAAVKRGRMVASIEMWDCRAKLAAGRAP